MGKNDEQGKQDAPEQTATEAAQAVVDRVQGEYGTARDAIKGLRSTKTQTAKDAKAARTALEKAAKENADVKEGEDAPHSDADIAKLQARVEELDGVAASAETAFTEGEANRDRLKGELDTAKAQVKEAKAADAKAKREQAEAEKAKRAEERKNRPKKAPLTLSQRRAVLKLAEGPLRPTTDMNRTPLLYLVEVGLAQEAEAKGTHEVSKPNPEWTKESGDDVPKTITVNEDFTVGEFTLTDLGRERAGELNPKWKTWKPASTETTTTESAAA